MTISIARLLASGSIRVRTVRCAGANEICGDAFMVMLSSAPAVKLPIASTNPHRNPRTLINLLPMPACASHGPHPPAASPYETLEADEANGPGSRRLVEKTFLLLRRYDGPCSIAVLLRPAS